MLWYCVVNIHMFVQIFRSIHFVRLSWVYRATVPFSTCNLSGRTNLILEGSGGTTRSLLYYRSALVAYAPSYQKALVALCALLPQCYGSATGPIARRFRWSHAPYNHNVPEALRALSPEFSGDNMRSTNRMLLSSCGAARPVASALWCRYAPILVLVAPPTLLTWQLVITWCPDNCF